MHVDCVKRVQMSFSWHAGRAEGDKKRGHKEVDKVSTAPQRVLRPRRDNVGYTA